MFQLTQLLCRFFSSFSGFVLYFLCHEISVIITGIALWLLAAFAPLDDALVPGTERKLSCTSFHLLALIGQNMGAMLLLSFMKFVASVPAIRPIFICGLVSDIHRPVRHSIVY